MTRITFLPALLVAGLTLGACGDRAGQVGLPTLATSNTPDAGPTTTVADPHAVALSFSTCMRGHGVEDYPDPVFSDTGEFQFRIDNKDDPDLRAASEACLPLLNAIPGFGKTTDPASVAAAQQRGLVFARCMRDAGYEWPDPVADGTPTAATIDPALKATAAFQSAVGSCANAASIGSTTP